ncbi:MAG: conjugative transfer signal peptidase TraF [Lentisphaerota bacterium]
MHGKLLVRIWPLPIVVIFLLIFILYEVGFRINITSSMPIGLYLLCEAKDLKNDDLVAVKLPPEIISQGLERGYIKTKDTILVKQLIALPGDKVIYKNNQLLVDDIYTYKCVVTAKDGQGRDMKPLKEGTYTLGNNEYLVLGKNDDSWDSRYFGPIERKNLINRVKLILTF